MQHEVDIPEDHRQRSEFIRNFVQRSSASTSMRIQRAHPAPPKTIMQYWHNLEEIPPDVCECVHSWIAWRASGFRHKLFDERTAAAFITRYLGARQKLAFERCYHPAMQADYFRLCYLSVKGGIYVDADDVCVGTNIGWLAEDWRLKLQPLCYDVATHKMIEPAVFLQINMADPNWIFYFNNNPLIAGPSHPVIEHALIQATNLLQPTDERWLPEIQTATGPGNLSKSIVDLCMKPGFDVDRNICVLREWNSTAISKWPLSYRDDARNWRLCNQKIFNQVR